MDDLLYFLFIAVGIIVSIINQANKNKKSRPRKRTVEPTSERPSAERPTESEQSVQDLIREILEGQQAKPAPPPPPAYEPPPEPLTSLKYDQELGPSKLDTIGVEGDSALHSLDKAKAEHQFRDISYTKPKAPARPIFDKSKFNMRDAIIMSEILNRKYQ